MAFIYKITNLINKKIYIGKTVYSIEKRWKEHIYNANNGNKSHMPIADAIILYGVNNFSIEPLEECSTFQASEREIYWINKLDSYNNGYNATLGGDGTLHYNYQLIVQKFLQCGTIKETAAFFNCSHDTVARACKEYNIDTQHKYDYQSILEKYKETHNLTHTALFFSCSPWVVANACKFYNYPIVNNQKDYAKIVDLYLQYYNCTKVGKILNCSRTTVSKACCYFGIPVQKQGRQYDYQEIAELYLKLQSTRKTANKIGCTRSVVQEACRFFEIDTYQQGFKTNRQQLQKAIEQRDKNTNALIKTFDSMTDAAASIDNNRIESIRKNISGCCRGIIPSAYGYKWNYAKN